MRARPLLLLAVVFSSLVGLHDASAASCLRMLDERGDAELFHDPFIDVPADTPPDPDTALDLLRADVDDDGRRLRVTITHGGHVANPGHDQVWSFAFEREAGNEAGDTWITVRIYRTPDRLTAYAEPQRVTGQDFARRIAVPVRQTATTVTAELPYAPFGMRVGEVLQEMTTSSAPAYGQSPDPTGSGQPVPVYSGSSDLAISNGFELGKGCKRAR